MSAPGPTTGEKSNLFGLDRERLRERFDALELPGYRANQAFRWLYGKRLLDPELWTDFPADVRARIGATHTIDPGTIVGRAAASDGTVKYRIALPRGGEIESVSMRQSGRITFCLSSQVGCALACDFCLTGTMGLGRHLDAGEILGQVVLMLGELDPAPERFNVVFMGMGEPLHNYDGVMAAVRLLHDEQAFGLSRQRITVSTSGMVPAIEKLAGEKVRPRLAVSLNATTDATRDKLMPINRKYNIDRLLEACRRFGETTGERFTFEYVLLAGINDTDADVERLVALTRRVPAKINLIPFNEVPELLAYRAPTREHVLRFRDRLLAGHARASIRWSRGADARAACGQLALERPA
jgi:23S rRNA (adenine2503-C2)-methyltransferase